MTNLTVIENKNSLQLSHKPEQLLKLIKENYAKGASDEEVEFFAQVCIQQNLDPIKRQIYFTKIWDSSQGKNCFAPIVSIDGMRSKAEETGLYAGQTIPLFCARDGIWKEIWADKDPPFACKIGVYRKDFKEPIYAIAYWDSYVKKTKEGKVTKFWADMPTTMLSKCAEAQALRKACPQKLSGLYSKEEMDNVIDMGNTEFKQSIVHAKPLQLQQTAKVETVFNAVNDFNSKSNAFMVEIDKLVDTEIGKYEIDLDFESSFRNEFFQYFKDEYIKNNGNVSIKDLFNKKLIAKRITTLSLRNNSVRDEKLNDSQLKELRKTVYDRFMLDTNQDLVSVFTEEANIFIPF